MGRYRKINETIDSNRSKSVSGAISNSLLPAEAFYSPLNVTAVGSFLAEGPC